MTDPVPSPEEIALGLTKAQRIALLYWATSEATPALLEETGLARAAFGGTWAHLNDLGRAVAAALAEMRD